MKNGDSLHQDDVFIQNLTQIVLNNLENEQFSVEDLSDQIGISRSHLYRKIKLLSGQSISQFIRQIRLQRAMEMLQDDVATATEIAYRVGFGSPSYFNKCFQEYYGYRPGEVRKAGEKLPSVPISTNERSPKVMALSERPTNQISGTARRKWLMTILVLLTVMMLDGYLFHFPEKNTSGDSIAILPLRYPSGDQEQEHLAIGLHDALIGAIGKHAGLRVISRTSTLRYREGGLLLADIAGELGVATILEGSVIGSGDSARLQLHLIDVFPEERQIWSEEYLLDFRQLNTAQDSTIRHIAGEIQLVLGTKKQDQADNTSQVGSDLDKTEPKELLKADLLANKYH